jgi:hypothetical protein
VSWLNGLDFRPAKTAGRTVEARREDPIISQLGHMATSFPTLPERIQPACKFRIVPRGVFVLISESLSAPIQIKFSLCSPCYPVT